MASPNPLLLNSKQHPDLLASLAPPARPWSPKAPSSTPCSQSSPSSTCASSLGWPPPATRCMGQPLISAGLLGAPDQPPRGLHHPVAWPIMPAN